MAVRSSSSARVEALIADLGSDREVIRETAVSRLAVLGTAAIEPLKQLIRNAAASPEARASGLRALDAIGHLRGLDIILEALEDGDLTVAEAATGAARSFLRGQRGADAVDRLTAIAMDRRRSERLRAAALTALSDLDASTLSPLLKALAGDPILASLDAGARGLRPEATNSGGGAAVPDTAAPVESPDNPDRARQAVAQAVAASSLPALQELIEQIRVREDQATPGRKPAWTAVRGVAHAALATRGSRLALYDLRESLERTTQPLPLDYLLALKEIGDASCLEAVAASHARVADEWWRGELAELFKNITAREGLTKRHAAMKRIARRWPGIVQ